MMREKGRSRVLCSLCSPSLVDDRWQANTFLPETANMSGRRRVALSNLLVTCRSDRGKILQVVFANSLENVDVEKYFNPCPLEWRDSFQAEIFLLCDNILHFNICFTQCFWQKNQAALMSVRRSYFCRLNPVLR